MCIFDILWNPASVADAPLPLSSWVRSSSFFIFFLTEGGRELRVGRRHPLESQWLRPRTGQSVEERGFPAPLPPLLPLLLTPLQNHPFKTRQRGRGRGSRVARKEGRKSSSSSLHSASLPRFHFPSPLFSSPRPVMALQLLHPPPPLWDPPSGAQER